MWCVIPAKPFEDAKTRLAPTLSADARHNFAISLFRHTCGTAVHHVGTASVLVVSRSPGVLEMAKDLGAHSLLEGDALDMNGAVAAGAEHAIAEGATSILVIPTDLPLLREQDLLAMTAHVEECALAPDRHGQGTNAMFWAGPAPAPYSFGPDSFQRHLRAMQERGRQPHIIHRSGLALDIDDLADLRLLTRLCDNNGRKPMPSEARHRRP